jgi:hypothetical protein
MEVYADSRLSNPQSRCDLAGWPVRQVTQHDAGPLVRGETWERLTQVDLDGHGVCVIPPMRWIAIRRVSASSKPDRISDRHTLDPGSRAVVARETRPSGERLHEGVLHYTFCVSGRSHDRGHHANDPRVLGPKGVLEGRSCAVHHLTQSQPSQSVYRGYAR